MAAYKTITIRLIAGPSVLVIMIALMAYAVNGTIMAYSVLLGGMACIVPNLCYLSYIVRGLAPVEPVVIVRWFYYAEAMKLLSAILFISLCYTLVQPLHSGAFFATYILMVLINTVGLCLTTQNRNKGLQWADNLSREN